MSKTIQPGQQLTARSISDYDTIFHCVVISRTPKRATVQVDGEVKTCGIRSSEEGEYIMPLGTYSMAPVFRAP